MTNPARIQPVFLVLIVLAAAFAWTAGATTNRPPAPPTTVATLDIVQVFDELEERTVLEAQLSERVQARQAQLDEIAQRIQAIRSDLEVVHTPGTEEYKESVRELMEQQAVAEARRNALTQIISIDQGSVRASLYAKIQEAVDKVAERDSVDLVILDDSLFPVPDGASDNDVYRAIITKSVIYRHDSIDITDRVITLLNSEYSAP